MTTVWNLGRLRYAIRKITGKLDVTQIPDSSNAAFPISATNPPGIDDYINDFYLYDFDEHLRTLALKDWYYFETTPNLSTYNLPKNYFTAEGPIYIDGYQIAWHQSPDIFLRIWPQLNFIQNGIVITDGINSTYSFVLQSIPIQQGTVVIGTTPAQPALVAQLETFTDPQPFDMFMAEVALISSNVINVTPGTINYLTGQVTINFTSVPPPGFQVNVHYYPYVASRPRDCLFFQQQFNFKPIPNDVYQVKVMVYQQPTAAILGSQTVTRDQFQQSSDMPTYSEWWQVIAYGAALKIFIEDSDHEQYQANLGYFEQAKVLAQRRALKQLSNQRIPTLYSQNSGNSSWPIFPFY